MNHIPVVLITGASRGIGRSLALAYAVKKYRIAVNYLHSEEMVATAADEIVAAGGEPLLLKADVGNSSQVRSMTEKIVRKWGRVDHLVNNAGVVRDRTILKMSDEEWGEVIRVNLSGAFYCLRECARIMSSQGEGAIINVSSYLGLRGALGSSNYASSKGALIALTKSAAREFGRYNIRVNAILPGFHRTGMNSAIWEKHGERILGEHVLGRTTELKELCRFIISIAEQKSASGQVFNFDSRIL